MSDILRHILWMTLTGSSMTALLYAVRPFFRHRTSKTAQYYAWTLALLALLLPIHLMLPAGTWLQNALPSVSFTGLVDDAVFPRSKNSQPLQPKASAADTAVVGSTTHNLYANAVSAAGAVWLLGAVISMLRFMVPYWQFVRKLKPHLRPAGAEETEMLNRLSGKRSPLLRCTPLMTAPMLVGVLRPILVLPATSYPTAELEHILLHELTHWRRRDLAVKWLSSLAVAVHWFNPLVYALHREMDKACELACDEAVIRRVGAETSRSYGETLLNAASATCNPGPGLSALMTDDKKLLKERLLAILEYKRSTNSVRLFSLLLLLCISGCGIAMGMGAGTNPQTPPASNFLQVMLQKNLLPASIVQGLTRYEEKNLEDSCTLHLWSSSDKEGFFIHKTELEEKSGTIMFYHYKNYEFPENPLPGPLSVEEGEKLALRFIDTFVSDAARLTFIREPAYPSLYDPGHVESWTAALPDGSSHVVMVDLDLGYVVFYALFQ